VNAAIWAVLAVTLSAVPAAAEQGVGEACPADAIRIEQGQSVGDAVERAAPGAAFCIAAGIHRMQFAVPKSGQRFFGEPGAILNGARVVTNFLRLGEIWVAGGQTQTGVERGVCASGYEACALSIGVFMDGQPLRQVAGRGLLRSGTFFFDRFRHEIVLVDSPDDKLVEVSATRYAFRSAADGVVIRGLVVEKYFNPAQEGAIHGEGRGWRVENCELRLNSGAGVAVGSDSAVSNCRIHHNGQIGATADGSNIIFDSNEIWSNNIYGFDPGWDAGGIKITVSSQLVFRNNHVHHNNGPGLWCDERCVDALFEGNVVEFNQSAGIFFELSSKAVIRRNTLRQNNQAGYSWLWGAEIQIAASEDADIYENTLIVRDSGRAVMLIDQNRWKVGGGFYKTRGNRVHDNDISFLGTGAAGGASSSDRQAENFRIITTGGNSFDRNVYRFRGGQPPIFIWDTLQMDFAGFRKQGQERNGSISAGEPPKP
jgi:hypothetical protein